jgi:pyruvate dehydrogenase E2 component (dihydrolipoamide acetyltransferase)
VLFRSAAVAASAAGQPAQASLAPVSPLARRLADENRLDLANVTGTGPRGQITREDVEAALAARMRGRVPEAPPAAAPGRLPTEVVPLSGVRGVIAERMSASSRETAPVTLTSEADATALVQLRERLNADGVPVSYNDLLLYALARALRMHLRLNASLDGESIKVWPQVDIGLAVDAERGLLVPVLRDVDRKGLGQIAAESKALAEKARAGLCSPDELKGGTFTLTNLGMFGIDAFTPIVNLPECAILGIGRIKTEPTWVTDHVEPRQRVWLSLTFDHRLVDGGPAARFLQTVVKFVEKPHLLMA